MVQSLSYSKNLQDMTVLYLKRKTIDGVKKIKKVSTSTVLILEESEKNGVEWEKISYTNLFKLTYNGKTKYFHGQIPSETTEFAYYCCNNKRLSKNILSQAGLSVTKGYQIEYNDKNSYRLSLFDAMKKPLVVKPVDDKQGNNVFLNIKTKDDFILATRKIYDFYGKKRAEILVEEMFVGDEYRILATQEKILSVIKRLPANVIGDGVSTIERLISVKNKNPLRTSMETYRQIVIDEKLEKYLSKQNLSLDSIPADNEQVFLRPHGPHDISLGGDTIDITEEIHPSVRVIVSKIMASIPGLSLAGIDYMCKDIHKEQALDNYKIIEINSSPSLDWNEYPLVGPRRKIAYEFLKIMFPELGS